MENILNKLILPDNASISEGTSELREAFKSVNAIPGLCSVIGSSPNVQIRQLAAVILRKKLTKHRYWLKLPLETKQFVKQGLMQAVVSEQEKAVKKAIGQVIGVLIRHEFPENGWPELMQFIQQMTLSENVHDKELGLFTLQVLTDMSGDQFLVHAHSFINLFTNILNNTQDHESNVCYLSLMCLINFVPAIEGDQIMVNAYHGLMPKILAIVRGLSTKRPDRAIEVFCLIDELADNAITVVTPHLTQIIQTCLELCHDKYSSYPDIQIKALNIIGVLVQTKKKQIVKLKLVEPILEKLFTLMCKPPLDDNSEEYFPDVDESSTPSTVANQTLDVLALHLPPEKLLPPLMQQYIVSNMNHSEPHVRKATYLAMAVIVEGCSEYIRQRHIQNFVAYIMAGLKDPSPIVSNAALFAVGQFSEHLQPNISVHASELVPFLLQHLKNISNKEDEPAQKVEKMFYALETFCENLNEGLLPFLPELMHYLIPLLSAPYPIYLRELAISTVGSCGNAVKEAMLPYFPKIMESLKVYLTQVQEPETLCLQVQSVDTLGIFAQTIGNANFQPMALESMELGIQLIKKTDDPDLRKSAYGLFASVSTVLKQDMAQYLPTIMEVIINALSEGCAVPVHQKEDNNPTVDLFENTIGSDDEAEEELGNTSDISSEHSDDDMGIRVENSYLEEKEQAIISIRELAQNCMEAFFPYLQTSFQEVSKLVNYPDDDIRSAAVATLSQLCIYIHKLNAAEGRGALLGALSVLVPKCAEIIRTDRERDVVISCLDVYQELLKEVGSLVLEAEGHADAIINCVKDVFNSRTECQDEGDDDEESEGDELLVESAGEIIPVLGKVMAPQQFAEHYSQFLPMFLNLTKKQASDSQRSFGVGMIAECMACAGPSLSMFATQLLSLLTTLASDPNGEVRNNAIYALGELVFHGRECIYPYTNQILQTLSTAVVNETNSGALDNICGALARLIITNVAAVPLEQVVPVFIKYLPLREDFEENKWVFKSISQLYQMGCQPLLQHLIPVIKVCAVTLHENQIETDNQSLVLDLIKCCHRDFPSECARAAEELPESIALTLKQACLS